MTHKVPIVKIDHYQELDICNSSGYTYYDDIARVCQVVKETSAEDSRGDRSPYRIAKLFGRGWTDYNHHFIIQVAGCPLDCSFCYVDNLYSDMLMSAKQIVNLFRDFKLECTVPLNVLHFMGGIRLSMYSFFWKEFRQELDINGLKDTILMSDTVLIENYIYSLTPWKDANLNNFILYGCLKGTSKENFKANSGKDLFDQALVELEHYKSLPNFFLALIGYEERNLDSIYSRFDRSKVDLLKIIPYRAALRK